MQFIPSDAWRKAFPGAAAGILVMLNVANPPHHPALNEHLQNLEKSIRAQFAGAQPANLRALPVLQHYRAYYKRFGKTYHVQLQLESVVFKGRPLASTAGALVQAMFAAEVHNLLLTAGHDLDSVIEPVILDVSKGTEKYTSITGREVVLKPGDMMMHDSLGIISSVLYGPDERTRLKADTRNALFTVYAPPGIGVDAVRKHLEEIEANVRLIAPTAVTALLETYSSE